MPEKLSEKQAKLMKEFALAVGPALQVVFGASTVLP